MNSEVKKRFSHVTLPDDGLKQLRLLVILARQSFINSILVVRALQLESSQEEKLLERIFLPWRINRRLADAKRTARLERLFLEDCERALEIAELDDSEEMKKREYYLTELEKREAMDADRCMKLLDKIQDESEKLSQGELLIKIRHQLAEISNHLKMEKLQRDRRNEWDRRGPPSSVTQEFGRT